MGQAVRRGASGWAAAPAAAPPKATGDPAPAVAQSKAGDEGALQYADPSLKKDKEVAESILIQVREFTPCDQAHAQALLVMRKPTQVQDAMPKYRTMFPPQTTIGDIK